MKFWIENKNVIDWNRVQVTPRTQVYTIQEIADEVAVAKATRRYNA